MIRNPSIRLLSAAATLRLAALLSGAETDDISTTVQERTMRGRVVRMERTTRGEELVLRVTVAQGGDSEPMAMRQFSAAGGQRVLSELGEDGRRWETASLENPATGAFEAFKILRSGKRQPVEAAEYQQQAAMRRVWDRGFERAFSERSAGGPEEKLLDAGEDAKRIAEREFTAKDKFKLRVERATIDSDGDGKTDAHRQTTFRGTNAIVRTWTSLKNASGNTRVYRVGGSVLMVEFAGSGSDAWTSLLLFNPANSTIEAFRQDQQGKAAPIPTDELAKVRTAHKDLDAFWDKPALPLGSSVDPWR